MVSLICFVHSTDTQPKTLFSWIAYPMVSHALLEMQLVLARVTRGDNTRTEELKRIEWTSMLRLQLGNVDRNHCFHCKVSLLQEI